MHDCWNSYYHTATGPWVVTHNDPALNTNAIISP